MPSAQDLIARISKSCGRRPFLRLGLPVGAASLCLPLLLGQTLSLPQATTAIVLPQLPATVDPDSLTASEGLTATEMSRLASQPGLQTHSATPALPPDLFTASSLLSSTPQPGRLSQKPKISPPTPPQPLPRPRFVPAAVPPATGPAPEIRIAISMRGENTNPQPTAALAVGVSTPTALVDDQGRVLGSLPANQAVYAQANGQSLLVGSITAPVSAWLQPANGGLFFLDGRWYRGRLRLIAQGNGLLAVNHVDLEQYVTSVVGAEVYPSWPMDVLKAQAIAARSYAVAQAFRPANRFFDLGNNQRWQVYQGIEDEWSTTHVAVKATRGLVLSKSGQVMVSMYAANDDIVRDVFGGRGMSQNGAYQLSRQGYNYLQILGAYYPGAGLAQLQAR